MLHCVGPQARLVQPSAAYLVMAYIVMADVGCCTGSAHKPGWYSLRRRVGTECEILFLYLAIPTADIEADDGRWTAAPRKKKPKARHVVRHLRLGRSGTFSSARTLGIGPRCPFFFTKDPRSAARSMATLSSFTVPRAVHIHQRVRKDVGAGTRPSCMPINR